MTLSLGPDLPEIRSAAVFGLARSGRAAVAALAERGVEVTGTDAKADLEGLAERPGVRYVLGGHPESLLDGIDLVVVSPGIPLTLPVFDAARARALPVVAEIELASRLLPGVVVGVTGTNGKSTTTALAAALLKSAGHYAVACGNFGTPWIHFATKEGANGNGTAPRTWVVELSSFQLEGIRRFAPDVAVHLNLTPDHLDRYRSMDDYGAAKARIFENQREAQVAVLNADDPLVARIRPRARRLAFSRRHSPGMGAWLADDLFLADVTGKGPRIVAVEPSACPSLTKGTLAYDFGDTAKLTPLIKMYTLGHDFVPPGIHAGGLRYHGSSPLMSHLLKLGQIEAKSYPQLPVFEAALAFARSEGILPAPESAHAIRAAVDEALLAREEGRARVILFGLSGHGHFDLGAYENYLSGQLQDYEYPGQDVARALAEI